MSYNFGQITASAGQTSGSAKSLTVANFSYPVPEEIGIGVCGGSDGGSLCSLANPLQQLNLSTSYWVGDITEIDNLNDSELLRLTVNAGYQMTGQFLLGSLDANGGTTSYEDGYVNYGANTVRFTRTATGAAITAGSATIAQAGAGFGDDVFLLTITNFSPTTITQVIFGSGGTGGSGTNNDYLVAAADVVVAAPVPVPGAAWLLGSAAAALLSLRRRTK